MNLGLRVYMCTSYFGLNGGVLRTNVNWGYIFAQISFKKNNYFDLTFSDFQIGHEKCFSRTDI